jgi:hypothetical protein
MNFFKKIKELGIEQKDCLVYVVTNVEGNYKVTTDDGAWGLNVIKDVIYDKIAILNDVCWIKSYMDEYEMICRLVDAFLDEEDPEAVARAYIQFQEMIKNLEWMDALLIVVDAYEKPLLEEC